MTSANLAATQKLFRIWNSRDFEALTPLITDDFEWIPATISAVEGRSFEGVDGFREFLQEWDQTWASWEVETGEIRDLGRQVLMLGRVHAEARESGLTLDQDVAYLFEFRDGLLARGQTFFDHEEAVAAAAERADGKNQNGVLR